MAQHQQGGSRLQKLLRLIDGGSSLDTRRAAAEQIAAIVAAHPAQLPAVVAQVSRHLRHKDWDARVAAGHCLGRIAAHVAHPTPAALAAAAGVAPGAATTEQAVKPDPDATADHNLLTFDTFSIEQVVSEGTPLLASAGEEFDAPTARADSLAQQRASLKKRLGISGAAEQFINTADFLADEDLTAGTAGVGVKKEAEEEHKKGATELLADMGGMSARERAAAARRAKAAKRKGPVGGGGAPGGKRAKSEASGAASSKEEGSNAAGAQQEEDSGEALDPEELEAAWSAVLAGAWPFQSLCDQLCVDVLSPLWEVRHGAALALREILGAQARSAGVAAPLVDPPGGWTAAGGSGPAALGPVTPGDAAAAVAANSAWLEDCTIHLLCTLALDRFGDYLSDAVVAPVRETAAQALGAAARALGRPVLLRLLRALRSLAECTEWEARHGGLQGLKYALAAQGEVDKALLEASLPSSIAGLKDKDDDVRAVAAEALLPAAADLAVDRSPAAAETLGLVWDALLTNDELSPAVKGAASLLAAVYTAAGPGAACLSGGAPLATLLPRLWPHLRHNLSSVRLSAVKCLAAVVAAQPVEAALPGLELGRAARLLFQNMLLESDAAVMEHSARAWATLVARAPPAALAAAVTNGNALPALFALASTPLGRKFDPKLFLKVPNAPALPQTGPGGEGEGQSERCARARLAAATALAQLAVALGPTPSNPVVPHITAAVRSSCGAARVVGGFTVARWAAAAPDGAGGDALRATVDAALAALGSAPKEFDEHASSFALLRRQMNAMSEIAGGEGVVVAAPAAGAAADVALAAASQLCAGGKASNDLVLAAQAVAGTASALQTNDAVLRTTAAAALAAAVVHAGALPPKLNALIQPLIASVRREPEPAFQEEGAKTLAKLAAAAVARTPSPTEKVVKNLCGFACGDPAAVPSAATPPILGEEEAEEQASGKGKAKGKTAAGAPTPAESSAAAAAELTRKGGEAALRALVAECGAALPTMVPGFWGQTISAAIVAAGTAPQAAVEGLRCLEVIAPALAAATLPAAVALLPALARCLATDNGAVQLSAARAVAALGTAHPPQVMPRVLDELTPLLAASAPDTARLGAVVAMREIVAALGMSMVPYVQLAVVPLLGRMSDPAPRARAVAAAAFAAVVALMPLAQGVPPPPGLSAAQEAMLAKEGRFLLQLLDNRRMEDFQLPFQLLTGTLRRYQQEGINWLAFLRRFGLHGVLADDMGLGKTLQATSIVAATAVEARARHAASGAPADAPRPSLIVCPATLVAHWPHEIAKFVPPEVLRPLQYHGVPAARAVLRPEVPQHDVVVMSYEALRADVDWVESIEWGYCVLDEGHAIRNPGSKVAQAAKRVRAQHRLILSGTPIQNSVIEMWALFEFLMPGFLGGERAFNARYGRALAASRRAGRGAADAEAGVLALEALHRQVMPFVLRRTKDQVLQDLPPKTVQDVVCDPGDLQRILYDDFAASQAMNAVVGAVQGGALAAAGNRGKESAPHVFQALHYLRRLCSHPLMVLDPGGVPSHARALETVLGPTLAADWPAAQASLRANLHHSPKLAAMRELLLDCGIGTEAAGGKGEREDAAAAADAGHRALVFAQTRAMLDLADAAVLAPLGVASLRIDGAVDAQERFRRVQRFNADPTIEVMLLTTAVGGLGLNLTAADTVIFLEHDWNPQKDLQAMDRAHRLGQRRAVNVYRLLVRGTLEEQVMSLQKFKLDVAAAVVNAENMSLSAMDTGGLLDLFALQEDGGKGKKAEGGAGEAAAAAAAAGVGGAAAGGLAAVLADLTDPAAVEAQYEEFDLEAFKQKLK